MVLKELSLKRRKILSSSFWMNNLIRNITNVSPEYKESVDWQTLLTRQVSHFKHETFSALQYAVDFGTI